MRAASNEGRSLSEQAQIRVVGAVVHPTSDLIGGTLVSTDFRKRFQRRVIGILTHGVLIAVVIGRVLLVLTSCLTVGELRESIS